jgi:hypothetical protein
MLPKLPPKFSYPEKPVTLSIPCTTCGDIDVAWFARVIADYVPITGVVPFDWCEMEQVPERLRGAVTYKGAKLAVFFFGFDTLAEAQAVQARFAQHERVAEIWTADEQRAALCQFLEQAEACGERPTIGDGASPEVYWRDHPMFRVN